MENYDDLKQYIYEIVEHGTQENENIAVNIKDAALAGFLIGKLSLAREHNIELEIINQTVIPEPQHSYLTHDTITIIGNLIDNSLEALTAAELKHKSIEVYLQYNNDILTIDVIDSGHGLSESSEADIFKKAILPKEIIGVWIVPC